MSTGNELTVVAAPAEIVSDSDRIEHVVRLINAVGKKLTFVLVVSVGKLVIEHFFAGDFQAWRKRHKKDVSLRKLSNHPALAMEPSELYRTVAMYELYQRVAIDPRGRLSTSHLRYCLPLPESEQERFLRRAEAEGWSVAKLCDEIACARPKRSVSRGGPKPGAHVQRLLRNLLKGLNELEDYVADGRRWRQESSFESAMEIATLVLKTQRLVDHMIARRPRTAYGVEASEIAEDLDASGATIGCTYEHDSEMCRSGQPPSPRVLIVEDNELVGRSLLRAVSWHGAAIVVGTVREAAALIADTRGRVDAAILDLQLPDGNGIELLAPLREHFPGARATILTGHPDDDAMNTARGLGADFMEKPMDPATIHRFLVLAGLPDRRLGKAASTGATREHVA